MNLRQLECICAIEEAGSLSAAAQKLGLTQQALSKSLKQLEKELGVELFLRSAAGMVPNPEAATILENAGEILESVDFLFLAANKIRESSSNIITVGIGPNAMGATDALVSIDAFLEFTKRLEGVEVRIQELSNDEIGRRVHLGLLDLAIMNDMPSPRCVSQNVFSSPLQVIVPKGSPLSSLPELHWSDLKGYKVINPFSDSSVSSDIVNRCMAEGFLIDFHDHLGRPEGNLALTRQPMFAYLCFGGESLIASAPDLTVLNFAEEERIDFYLEAVWNKKHVLTDTDLKLIGFFKQELNMVWEQRHLNANVQMLKQQAEFRARMEQSPY